MRRRWGFACARLVALAMSAAAPAIGYAQMPFPTPSKLKGADLFNQQCGTCHSLNPADPPRQGPLLAGVYGRKPGSLSGFRYSAGYAAADFVWDETHLDPYLTDPQSVIAGSVMLYRQNDAGIRREIISFLKERQ
jgi:cytochrome c